MSLGLPAAAVAAVAWAIEPLVLSVCLDSFSPYFLTVFRLFVGFVVISGSLVVRDYRSLYRSDSVGYFPLILAAICLSGNYFGYLQGITFLGPEEAVVLLQTGPVFLIFIGYFCLGDPVTRRQFYGIALALFGFALFYFGSHPDAALNDTSGVGALWIVFAGASWASFAAIVKKISTGAASVGATSDIVTHRVFGLAFLILLAAMTDFEIGTASTWDFFLLCLAGSLNAIAYIFVARALASSETVLVSCFIVLNPLITIILSSVLAWFGIYLGNRFAVNIMSVSGIVIAVSSLVFALIGASRKPSSERG